MTLRRERPPNLFAKRVMEAELLAILAEDEAVEECEIISTSELEAMDMGESATPRGGGGGREEEEEGLSSKRESSELSESRSIGTTAADELSRPIPVTERPAEDEFRLSPAPKEAGEADLELMSGRFRGGAWWSSPVAVATEEDREEPLGGRGGRKVVKEEEEVVGGFIPKRGIGSPSSSAAAAGAVERKYLEVVAIEEEEEEEEDLAGLDVCATGLLLLGTRTFGIGREADVDGFE